MILVADSGSSKTDWRLINQGNIQQFSCHGLNPDFNTIGSVFEAIIQTFPEAILKKVDKIHFYGSGCSSKSRNRIVEEGMRNAFKNSEITVYHDVLGAARAACGDKAGIAGILGTGSNCCLYDGKEVIKEYRTGGFVIGDEGGGVYLGKMLIKAFIEEKLPDDLCEKFEKRYSLTVDAILERLYKQEFPNRFLASFSQFVFHHREHEFIAKLIYKNFEDYLDNQVLRYKEAKELPLNLVGSIAFYYQEYLRRVAADKGVLIGTILEKPISGLSLYHSPLGE